MVHIHIVTDSGARFGHNRILQDYPITIVPNTLLINGKSYREDIDISTDEVMQQLAAGATVKLIPPSVADYSAAFAQAARGANGVISIHPSRELSRSWHHGREASAQISGTNELAVIDSGTLCAGQGMLVRVAAQAAQDAADFESLVQIVRGAIERTYSIYCTETLETLYRSGLVAPSRAILSSLLGVKPFLSIEQGHLDVTEKVRTRAQAIEHLVAFLAEFDELDDAVIVQQRQHITDTTRALQDRLSVEFPGRHFPFMMYGSAMASLIGPDATGIVILERSMEIAEDDL